MQCSIQTELSAGVSSALQRLANTIQRQLDAVRAGDEATASSLDLELERLMGEKERTFGALKQHRSEHGC